MKIRFVGSIMVKKLYNLLCFGIYWPLCRIYARYLGDRPADNIYRLLCSLQFLVIHGFWPDLKNPSYFTEYIWARMLYERDPILTKVSDKMKVRSYVAEKLGKEFLIPLLWVGSDPKEIPYDKLPSRFVIKTNHGCHFNIIVKDKTHLNKKIAEKQLERWLSQNYCLSTYLGSEWGYKNIKPMILIEEFISEGNNVPIDYKFYCFNGKVEFLTAHFDRFGQHRTKSFDRNFQPYDFRYDFKQWSGNFSRPENFEKMVEISETLSNDFTFMRIDLYNIEGRIYFGEMTPYPGGVSTKFLPRNRDFYLGSLLKNKK